MGFMDYIMDRCDFTIPNCKNHRPILKTVEIEVDIDCNGCERRIRNVVSRMRGARRVEVNRAQCKVTVEGYVEEEEVLQAVRRTGKAADLWRYVPYKLAAYPYAEPAYDAKAPSGYVRDVPQAFDDHQQQHLYTYLFSDDNPHACSIM